VNDIVRMDESIHLAAELIKKWEGLRLKAYRCPAGILTVGYGHTGPDVTEGMEIDLDEAEAMLLSDIWEAEDCIENHVDVDLTDGQRAALISFVFNLGCSAFKNSTLLKLLNQKLPDAAAAQLLRWNKANNKVMAGLTNRRNDERKTFLDVGKFEQHGLA